MKRRSASYLDYFLVCLSLLLNVSFAFAEQREATPIEQQISLCRQQPISLLRLSCYDKIQVHEQQNIRLDISKMGEGWQRIFEHEMQRKNHSSGFIVSQGQNNHYPVLMTMPAIGHQPPRPVLMLSCIDNITRMQITLPWQQKTGEITLTTNHTEFSSQWFLREQGYLLESSRGLAGIEEIKRLLSGDKLTIKLANRDALTFNISGLSEEIIPLRTACHW